MEEPTGVLGTPGCFGVQVQNPLPVTPSPVLGKTEHFWGTFSSAATPPKPGTSRRDLSRGPGAARPQQFGNFLPSPLCSSAAPAAPEGSALLRGIPARCHGNGNVAAPLDEGRECGQGTAGSASHANIGGHKSRKSTGQSPGETGAGGKGKGKKPGWGGIGKSSYANELWFNCRF